MKFTNLVAAVGITAAAAFGGAAITTPEVAEASPGQCMHGSGGGFGSGGFCDSYQYPDGTFDHCETVYVFGIGGTNCFRARPVPTSVDPRGWIPA